MIWGYIFEEEYEELGGTDDQGFEVRHFDSTRIPSGNHDCDGTYSTDKSNANF